MSCHQQYFGGCTAIRAAKEGAKVVCVDIKKNELNETIEQIRAFGGEATAILADISQSKECNRIITETIEKYGKLDLVLNAAGVMDGNDPSKPQNFEEQTHLFPSSIHNATDEYWDLVMKANITAMFYAMRAQLNQFLKQETGGSIVNIGSIAGIIGLSGNAAYSASKHAVIGLT